MDIKYEIVANDGEITQSILLNEYNKVSLSYAKYLVHDIGIFGYSVRRAKTIDIARRQITNHTTLSFILQNNFKPSKLTEDGKIFINFLKRNKCIRPNYHGLFIITDLPILKHILASIKLEVDNSDINHKMLVRDRLIDDLI